MGVLPSTNADVLKLETELAAYFGGMGKGHRGFVVLQLARILADKTADTTYGAAATAWNTEVAASIADSTNQTIVFTNKADTLAGGQGDDIFTAISAALASANTLNTTDVVAGGTGNDTLNVDVGTNWTGFTTGSISGIENLALTNSSNSDQTFVATGISGVTALTVNAAAGSVSSITKLPSGLKTINLNGQTGSTVGGNSASFATTFAADSAELTATTDAVALNLNGVGGTSTAGKGTVSLSLGSFDIANITSTGANVVSLANSTALKTITATGAGTLSLTAVPAAATLTTFDGSAATGAITAVLTASTGGLKSISTGSGKDTVTAAEQDMTANATLAGGDGADTLKLASDGGTVQYKMSGFETLALGSVSGSLLFSGTNTTSLSAISSTEDTSSAVDFVNMGSGALAFTSTGATTNAVTADQTGTASVTYTGSGLFDATTSGGETASGSYVFDAATGPLTVAVGGYSTVTGGVTGKASTSVVLTVDSSLDKNNAQANSFNGAITADKATSISVVAAGNLGSSAAVNAKIATSAEVTSGASSSTLKLNTPKLTSLTVTAGNTLDLNPTGTSIGAVDTLNVTANKGTTTIGALVKASSITLAGAGTTTSSESAVLFGTTSSPAVIGGDIDNNMTITATGLKGGVIGGTINVGAGFNVTLDTSKTTGAVSFTSIGGTTVGKNVTVTHAGSTNTLSLANGVSGTGTVTIDASGTKGATLGDVKGDAVIVNISGTTNASTVGTITGKSSIDLSLYELAANPSVALKADAGATAMTVKVNGGVLADAVTFTGISGLKTFTATGDLGASADSFTYSSVFSTAQTVNIAGITSYNTGTVTTGSGADTITTGAGADTIRAGAGADTIIGGTGVNTYLFAGVDSPYTAPDWIKDLKATDVIFYDNATIAKATAVTASSGSGVANISSTGVATFDEVTAANKDSFLKVVNLVDSGITTEGQAATFAYGSDVYLFIDTGTAANDLVIKITGSISLPLVALALAGTDLTGLTGFSS